MKKFLLTIGFLFVLAIGAQAQTGCVELREIDGAPDVKCVKIIRVTNGTLSCTGTTCTITISGGGGGSPGGSDTQLQYNNSGSFGGITGATTNGTVVTLTNALATTAFSPSSNDGAALGSGTASFSDLFLASGALINFANGNAVITHSSGIITVSTGDLRVTTAGTNTASAVTVGGTQTLTNKTLASPSVTGNISAEATSLLFFGGNYYRYINGTGPATYDVTTDMVLTFNVQSLTDNRTVTWPDTALTVAGINVANSWSAGVKQTFAPNGTTAGINVGSVAGDPSAPANGDLWYDSTANELTARINGANVALGSGGGGGITVGTTTITSGTATRLFYETAGNVVGQVSGVTSDGTNVTAGSGNLRATSPRITTGINDANGNESILLTATASAVNEWTATNAATGGTVTLAATGDDANIPINIWAKGTAAAAIAKFGTTGGWQLQVSNSIGIRVATVDAGTTNYLSLTAGHLRVTSGSTIGWSSLATVADTGPDAFFMRSAAAHIRMGSTDAASPVAQTLSVQNVVGGTTNTAGTTWTLRGSLGTSQGVPGRIHLTGGAMIAASGTTQQTAVDRIISGATKVLTNNSATTIVNVTNATGTSAGGVLDYCVEVTDGVDTQYECGMATYGISNKAGVFSGNTVTKFGNHQNATSGTLTVTFAISGANPGALSINANSSLTPSTGYPRVVYSLRNLGNQAVAIQ